MILVHICHQHNNGIASSLFVWSEIKRNYYFNVKNKFHKSGGIYKLAYGLGEPYLKDGNKRAKRRSNLVARI